ncbi:MAG: segregation/condensation protein [Clostridia bacterium]|jgi:segregation and condensation protein A|nr:segregation/condensation protein [Clostridia bacterium]
MSIKFKLENFEGPLDLLLHLIEKAEVDIYDIPISEIAQQYLEYLEFMQKMDLEVASEFLVMAATLVEIKSKMLLPKPKKEDNPTQEIDPREELVQKLIEYKKYKEFTLLLKDKFEIYEKVFYKSPEPIEDYLSDFTSITGVSADLLAKTLNSIIQKNSTSSKRKVREIHREVFTVDDKIKEISRLLVGKSVFYFEELFDKNADKYEVIVTFLAILELVKRKLITVQQYMSFDRILVKRKKSNS